MEVAVGEDVVAIVRRTKVLSNEESSDIYSFMTMFMTI